MTTEDAKPIDPLTALIAEVRQAACDIAEQAVRYPVVNPTLSERKYAALFTRVADALDLEAAKAILAVAPEPLVRPTRKRINHGEVAGNGDEDTVRARKLAVMVVEAPTGVQCDAGLKALMAHGSVNYADQGTMREVYRAMLAAAPEPPHDQ
jgi:hypothetical protein